MNYRFAHLKVLASVVFIVFFINYAYNVIVCLLNKRPGDMEDKYVLPALQLTLKNLQLDYLDLYLIHSPFAFRHGVSFANLKEEDKLGYDESRVSGIWKV